MDALDRRVADAPGMHNSQAQPSPLEVSPPNAEFETPQAHPCHQHKLVRVDACRLYANMQQTPGQWHCNHCKQTSRKLQQRYPWHCVTSATSSITEPLLASQCLYDLCDKCFHGTMHPLHEHRLRLADANAIYQSEQGIWACEYCNLDRMTTRERYPYHCSECGTFDLCCRCYEGIRHPLHPHNLQPAKADLVYAEHGGMWFCDMCHNSRKQLREAHMWHCVTCKFDLCVSCAAGALHPSHSHKLYLADADVAYASFNGLWTCDSCSCSRRASGQRFMRHCAECSYDLCNQCFLSGLKTTAGLQLSPTEKQVAAARFGASALGVAAECRVPRSKSGTVRVGSIGSEYDEVDFTEDPKKQLDQPLMVDLSTACENTMASKLRSDHRKQQEEKESEERKEQVSTVPAAGRSHGDGQLCLLCMDRQRNATFVHGSTGHLACCMVCARQLHDKRDPCPVCRQPIDAVIEQFIA